MQLNIQNLISDEQCYKTVRELRWSDGKITCPHCNSLTITRKGKDDRNFNKQRYECKACGKRFDDLTNTPFSSHHKPLKIWILFLYFMGLNLSTSQIAKELDLNKDDAHEMDKQLRDGIVKKNRILS